MVKNFFRITKSFLNDDGGATAAEYAVVTAFIVAVGITPMGFLGDWLSGVYVEIADALPAIG